MKQNRLYEFDHLVVKCRFAAFGLLFWAALFAFLQTNFRYHFYYIEQSQLFLFSKTYWWETVSQPGGFSRWAGEFLVQFFVLPYAGSAIVATLLMGVAFGVKMVMERICPSPLFFLLYMLPSVALLWMHFDFNYRTQGTVAYLLMLILLAGYVRIPAFRWRFGAAMLLLPLLFLTGGAIVHLFTLSIFLFEWMKREQGWYKALLFPLLSFLLAAGSVFLAISGEYRRMFFPDLYYHDSLLPTAIIYVAWAILPVVMLQFYWMHNRSFSGKRLLIWGGVTIQLLLLTGLVGWSAIRFGDRKSMKLKMLDYYTRTEQWDLTIAACRGKLTNFLYLCHLNMALANKGLMSDRMFAFDQRNINGLLVKPNKSENVSCLLSDVYFAMGITALSQEMAFEGYVCAMDNGNPRMLKRLVQTNLIYGAYPVAEKYISVLEKTFAYRNWAKSQRKFLYCDEKVENDPVLGERRRALPAENNLAQMDGLTTDLERTIEANPALTASIQYLGAFYLLSKDLERFDLLIKKFYGTKALPVLPLHFQEAIVILSEKNPEYLSLYQISEQILARSAEFRRKVLASRNTNAAPEALYRSFGNSYWFYYMFK